MGARHHHRRVGRREIPRRLGNDGVVAHTDPRPSRDDRVPGFLVIRVEVPELPVADPRAQAVRDPDEAALVVAVAHPLHRIAFHLCLVDHAAVPAERHRESEAARLPGQASGPVERQPAGAD